MSDISIPGVTDKYNTAKMVEDLMKVERIPKTRAEDALKKMQTQKAAWQDVSVRMSRLRDSSSNLFSYKNPFADRVADSADTAAFTATADRNTLEQTKTIEVRQVAAADRFLSGTLPKDYKVPAGDYSFSVGGSKLSFTFPGGSLDAFADALTKRGKGVIGAQVVTVEAGSRSLLIESLKTGAANRLALSGAAQDLALATKMMGKATTAERALSLSTPQPLSGQIDPSLVSSSGGVLSVKAGGSARIPVSPAAPASGKLLLEVQARLVPRPESAAQSQPSGPSLPATGSVSYGGVSVSSDPSDVALPAWQAPPVPVTVVDPQVLQAKLSSGAAPALPPVQDGDFQTITVPLSSLGGDLSSLDIQNRNTGKDLEIRSARLYDPTETGGLVPLNPVSTASDAIVRMDGIEVKRDTNSVDDLIPGVTLSLHDVTSRPTKLTVKGDTDSVKNAIIGWVGYYNQLMAWINIYSKDDSKVIEEVSYLTDDEKKKANDSLGLFLNDFTLTTVRTALQNATSSTYPTDKGSTLSLLAQIGISTNQSSGGGYDVSKMRGYLEMDEAKLDQALKDNLAAVKQLFGSDTNGDLVVDSGVAFKIDAQIKPYVQTGGLLAMKQSTLDGQIDRQKKDIATLDEKLAEKEQEYKETYGKMAGSLQEMQRTSSSLDNFSKSGSQ